MLLDARTLSEGHRIRRDVCIVGGGPAGLTLADQLADSGITAVVIEAGGVAFSRRAQQFYSGCAEGEPYYRLDACRFRLLGGSTRYWGGWCRPLDNADFELLDGVAGSAWPFEKKELDPFYRRAQAICGLGPFDYRPRSWTDARAVSLLSDREHGIEDAVLQIRPMRFGEVHSTIARQSLLIDIVVNATVVALEGDRTRKRVTAVHAVTPQRRSIVVHAGAFVLAAGGIENARMLLLTRQSGSLLRDSSDTIGRYFSDHLHIRVGVLRPRDTAADFYQCRSHGGVTVRGAATATQTIRRTRCALAFGATLHNAHDPHDVLSLAQVNAGYTALHNLLHPLRSGRVPDSPLANAREVVRDSREVCRLVYRRFVKPRPQAFIIGCRAEQSPSRDNRVTLHSRRDALGLPTARLEWRLEEQDLTNVSTAQTYLAEAFREHHVEMFPRDGMGGWRRAIAGGAHHIGTTRMHRDPALGVVDEECRVHGTTNLYVAGSSVFPRGGWAPPTLTIVALAVRLADKLVGRAAHRHA